MSTENNETMDVSTVCEMMEDIKASQAKQLTGIEKLLSKSTAAPSAFIIEPFCQALLSSLP
jgi:hypothetical protein